MSNGLNIAFARPDMGPLEAQAAAAAVRSGWIVAGPRLQAFEAGIADLCGQPHAVGASSWTTAAFMVLKALGIGPGDEVIVPSLTFIASVNVIAHVGATPVFAEVDPRTFNIDPDDIAHRITPRTKAILPVDQLGLPCDLAAISEIAARHGLLVIEDAACALGSQRADRPVGAAALVAIFSLHARKPLTTAEGGMIVTGDATLAESLRRMRHQGMNLSDHARHGLKPTVFESYPEIGYNFRLTDVQAAMGLVQLGRFKSMLAQRAAVAAVYNQAFTGQAHLLPPHVPAGMVHNWQSYQLRLSDDAPVSRNDLMDQLHERGVQTRRGVMASHREAPYRDLAPPLPVTDATADKTLQLPMHSQLTVAEAQIVADAVIGLVGKGQSRRPLAASGNPVRQAYEKLLADHGPQEAALGWSKGKQPLRFTALTAQLPNPLGTVLDAGCGLGDLYPFLSARQTEIEYTGIDMVPGFVAEASKRYPAARFRQVDDLTAWPDPADHVILSGVFNLRGDRPVADHRAAMFAALRHLAGLARQTLSVDFLTTAVDFQQPGSYHQDPDEMLAFLKEISPRVILDQARQPYEFTITLFTNAAVQRPANIYA